MKHTIKLSSKELGFIQMLISMYVGRRKAYLESNQARWTLQEIQELNSEKDAAEALYKKINCA